MDHVMSADAREENVHQRVVAALRGRIVLVDETGEVVWTTSPSATVVINVAGRSNAQGWQVGAPVTGP